ncbi:MAG: hypothetical protein A4S09_00720 [Proteobacteria bacterium SG_bin7]|nr:MAG: hypothetical protein A4S09_00720 [Proteobacteria bacterium SG_bin7]
MDELDDSFEFRPITEGLGFHRKVKSIRDEIEGANIAQEELSSHIPTAQKSTLDGLMTSLNTKIDFLSDMPLEKPKSPAMPVPKIELKKVVKSQENEKTSKIRELHLCPISFSFSAMVFDAIMSFALSLLFLIGLVVATDMDLGRLLQASTMFLTNQIGLAVLYIAVAQLYVIATRAFAGQTLGEWAFDVQLGTNEDQEQALFPLLVFTRAILITITGVIILPLIALVFGTDYAAKILSLRLYRAE